MHAVGSICIPHRVTGGPPRRLRSVTGVLNSRSAKASPPDHRPGPTSTTRTLCSEVNLLATAGRRIRSPDTSAATVSGESPSRRARNTRPIPPEPSLPSRRYVRDCQLDQAADQCPSGAPIRSSRSGEWVGGRVEDPLDDFIGRYTCTFWRLISQGIAAAEPVPSIPSLSRASVSRPTAHAVLPTRQDHARVMRAFES